MEEVADRLESGWSAAAEDRIGRIGSLLDSVGAAEGVGWSEVSSTDSAEVGLPSLEEEDLGSIPTDPEKHQRIVSEGLRRFFYLNGQKLRVQQAWCRSGDAKRRQPIER